MKSVFRSYRIIAFSICILLYVLSVWIFHGLETIYIDNLPKTSDIQIEAFHMSFQVFILLSGVLVGLAFISKNTFVSALIVECVACLGILAFFTVPGSLSIKLCISFAVVIACGIAPRLPLNLVCVCLSVLAMAVFQNDLFIINGSLITPDKRILDYHDRALLVVFNLGVGIIAVCIRYFIDGMLYDQEIKEHGQQVMKQLTLFNQKLQAHAREASEESALKERDRITREMHDSNGYAFTNIMALMNAAISSGRQDWTIIEDILQTTWKQAHDGLLESRMTLRTLRNNIAVPSMDLFRSIHEICSIFQECTGISIHVNYGNIENNYGSAINKAFARIIQEALTNAVRHGRATEVSIQFWMSNNVLSLYVEDNGSGSTKIVKGLGLSGMEERVAPYGGSVLITAPVGGGFKLTILLPLNKEGTACGIEDKSIVGG